MIQMDAKIFFRDKEILKFMDVKTARAMSRALSHIWRRAQTSMRYRKKPSEPGDPPSAHKEHGARIRKLMRFAFDPRVKIGVAGPLKFGKGEAPGLQEFGGQVVRRSRKGAVRVVTLPERPFMEPALAIEIPKLPQEWASSVSGGE